jgi:hypothetical protein
MSMSMRHLHPTHYTFACNFKLTKENIVIKSIPRVEFVKSFLHVEKRSFYLNECKVTQLR